MTTLGREVLSDWSQRVLAKSKKREKQTIQRRPKPIGNPITKRKDWLPVTEPMSATDRLVADARQQLVDAALVERQSLDEAIQHGSETLASLQQQQQPLEMETVTLRHRLSALYSDYLYNLAVQLNQTLLHDYTDDAYEIVLEDNNADGGGVCTSEVLTLHTGIRHLIGETTSQLCPFMTTDTSGTDDYLTEAGKLATFTNNLQQALVDLRASLDKHRRVSASLRHTAQHDLPLDPENDRFALGFNNLLQKTQEHYAFIFAEQPTAFRNALMALTGKQQQQQQQEVVATEEESADDDAVIIVEKKKQRKIVSDDYIEEVEQLIGEKRKAGTRLARGHIHYVLSARDIRKEVVDVLNEYDEDERAELEAYGDPMIGFLINLITVMGQLNGESDTYNTVSLAHYNEALRVFQFTLHDQRSGGTTYLYDMVNVAYERLVKIVGGEEEEEAEVEGDETYEEYARFLFALVVTGDEATDGRSGWDPKVAERADRDFDELRYTRAAALLIEAYRQARGEFRAFGEPQERVNRRTGEKTLHHPLVTGREPMVADLSLLLNRRPRLKTIYAHRAIAELEREQLKDERARERAAKRHEAEARVYRNLMRSTDKLVLGMLAKGRVYYRIALMLSQLLVEVGALPASYSLHSQWPYLVNKGHTDEESSSSSSDDDESEERNFVVIEDSEEEEEEEI